MNSSKVNIHTLDSQMLTLTGKTDFRSSNCALTQRQRKLSVSEDVTPITRDTTATSQPLPKPAGQGSKVLDKGRILNYIPLDVSDSLWHI